MTQLIAPPELTIQTLPYGWKGKQRLAVTLMLATPIDNHHPYSTQDAWNGIMQVIPKAEIFDLGYPKPRGEVLAYGNYYAPDGFAISSDKILLQAGNVRKELIVTGERLWRRILTPTTPEPFTQIPLTYEMGFGGVDDERNPLGKGYPLDSDTPMPQLEYPEQLLVGKHQKPTPAGLNATSVDWMPRKKLWGTYDLAWQEQDAPFLARDLDPDFFMQAAPDQWFDHYILPNLPIRLENMHPSKRRIEGQIPDYQLCFLSEQNGAQTLHQTTTDTLILLPEINMQVLLARTELNIQTLDGSEITALMAGYYSPAEKDRDLKHYNNHLQLRRSDDITDEQLLDYSPLRPAGVTEPLTPLAIPRSEKAEVAAPGAMTLAALAAAGGLAGKLAAAAAKKNSESDTAETAPQTNSSSSASPAPTISQAHADQAAEALKAQFAAMGLTDEELNKLMQAPHEQVPALINQMLSRLFPDQPMADPDNLANDPIVKQQLERTVQLSEESAKAIPTSGDPLIDEEVSRTTSSHGKMAKFDILEPLIAKQLEKISEDLKDLYEAYPGDKNELEQPSDIGTKAIMSLLKGLSG